MKIDDLPNGIPVLVSELALRRAFTGWRFSHISWHYGVTGHRHADGDCVQLGGEAHISVPFDRLEEEDVRFPISLRMMRVLAIAKTIGDHWHDQGGVNAALLDELAKVTR